MEVVGASWAAVQVSSLYLLSAIARCCYLCINMGCGGSKKSAATETTQPADTETTKPADPLLVTGTNHPEVKPAAAESDPVAAPTTEAAGQDSTQSATKDSPPANGEAPKGEATVKFAEPVTDTSTSEKAAQDPTQAAVEQKAAEKEEQPAQDPAPTVADQQKTIETQEPKLTSAVVQPTGAAEANPIAKDGLEPEKQLDIKVSSGCCPSGQNPTSAIGFLRCCDAKAEADQA